MSAYAGLYIRIALHNHVLDVIDGVHHRQHRGLNAVHLGQEELVLLSKCVEVGCKYKN